MSNEQKNLAVRHVESVSVPATIERIAYYQSPPSNEPESGENAIPFAHYRWMINRHKWRLLLFIAIAVGATVMVSSRLTKYYESTVTIDVDRAAPQGVIGQDAAVGRTAAFNDSELFLQTQIQLIKSDSVLRPVVQKLRQRRQLTDPAPAQDDGPVVLDHFAVTRPPRTYLLLISYRSPDPELAAQVANDVAESYIKHSYVIRGQDAQRQSEFMARQLEDLKAKMETSSAALLQFEKDLDVIDPEKKTDILSARLLQLNTEWTNAREDLVKKDAADRSVRSGSVEALEASLQGEQLKKLEEQMGDEAQKFAAIKTQFGPNYPEYKKAAAIQAQLNTRYESLKSAIVQRMDSDLHEAQDREAQLHRLVDEEKAQFDKLNSKSLEYKNLKRDAEADKAIFDDLSKKIKEAGINAGFQSNGIRIADPARPAHKPVYPRMTFNAIVAFLVSLCLGIAVIFVSESLDRTLRDPDQIQRQLQTEVLGALPVVKAWRGHLPLASADKSSGDKSKPRPFFGGSGTANTYEEAIRTLRDSILLPNGDRRPKSLLITSATPREGKTTTAVHLAVVHSQQKRRTLLIDSDLRRPGVYHHAGVSNDKGFSDVINDDASWRDLLQTPEGLPHLDVLPAGPPSRRAADGVGAMLQKVLAEAANDYDLVICDAPPLLGFAESLQIAALVDGVVVVALAGQTERAAVASVFSSLKRLKTNVIGLVLNEVRSDMSERYYYYGYYGKYYSRHYKTAG